MNFLSRIQPQKLFLIDALGALLSALMLGGVLVYFRELIGLPQRILYLLAGLAALFAVYSFTCFLRTPVNWRPYLRLIATVNLLYCCLTAVLVFLYQDVTALGIAYFVAEIIIVVSLAIYEWRTAQSHPG